MFTYIVLTAPSEHLCEIYKDQLDFYIRNSKFYSNCKTLVVSDPEGCRVGSGGGTLNAIYKLIDEFGEFSLTASKIAIIHSGGDSRRSPLQSITGKAWSNINCINGRSIASPFSLLIEELNSLCSSLPSNSLVIASSDVLINFSQTKVSMA